MLVSIRHVDSYIPNAIRNRSALGAKDLDHVIVDDFDPSWIGINVIDQAHDASLAHRAV